MDQGVEGELPPFDGGAPHSQPSGLEAWDLTLLLAVRQHFLRKLRAYAFDERPLDASDLPILEGLKGDIRRLNEEAGRRQRGGAREEQQYAHVVGGSGPFDGDPLASVLASFQRASTGFDRRVAVLQRSPPPAASSRTHLHGGFPRGLDALMTRVLHGRAGARPPTGAGAASVPAPPRPAAVVPPAPEDAPFACGPARIRELLASVGCDDALDMSMGSHRTFGGRGRAPWSPCRPEEEEKVEPECLGGAGGEPVETDSSTLSWALSEESEGARVSPPGTPAQAAAPAAARTPASDPLAAGTPSPTSVPLAALSPVQHALSNSLLSTSSVGEGFTYLYEEGEEEGSGPVGVQHELACHRTPAAGDEPSSQAPGTADPSSGRPPRPDGIEAVEGRPPLHSASTSPHATRAWHVSPESLSRSRSSVPSASDPRAPAPRPSSTPDIAVMLDSPAFAQPVEDAVADTTWGSSGSALPQAARGRGMRLARRLFDEAGTPESATPVKQRAVPAALYELPPVRPPSPVLARSRMARVVSPVSKGRNIAAASAVASAAADMRGTAPVDTSGVLVMELLGASTFQAIPFEQQERASPLAAALREASLLLPTRIPLPSTPASTSPRKHSHSFLPALRGLTWASDGGAAKAIKAFPFISPPALHGRTHSPLSDPRLVGEDAPYSPLAYAAAST
jgi:hypothetical protein